MQTKKQSVVESITSTVIGYILALVAQIIIFPMYGINVTIIDNLSLITYFTILSLIRNYCIRRYFNKQNLKTIGDNDMGVVGNSNLIDKIKKVDLESAVCVCTAISCPSFVNSGCNRYTTSAACHLSECIKPLGLSFTTAPFDDPDAYNNQYGIYLKKKIMVTEVESDDANFNKVMIPISSLLKVFNEGYIVASNFFKKDYDN